MQYGQFIKDYGNIISFYFNKSTRQFIYTCEWKDTNGCIVEHRYFKETTNASKQWIWTMELSD